MKYSVICNSENRILRGRASIWMDSFFAVDMIHFQRCFLVIVQVPRRSFHEICGNKIDTIKCELPSNIEYFFNIEIAEEENGMHETYCALFSY